MNTQDTSDPMDLGYNIKDYKHKFCNVPSHTRIFPIRVWVIFFLAPYMYGLPLRVQAAHIGITGIPWFAHMCMSARMHMAISAQFIRFPAIGSYSYVASCIAVKLPSRATPSLCIRQVYGTIDIIVHVRSLYNL